VAENESDVAQAPAPTAAAKKRAQTVGTIAVAAGVLAAVVGLVGVLNGGSMDPIDLLLFAGGMLVSVLGFRGLRRVRTS
jgi:flagellar motor component MotA